MSKNLIEYILFVTLGKIFSIFGIRSARYFAKFLALFLFYIIPIRKKTVISNLTFAFPNLTSKEIKKLALKNFYSSSITLVELFSIKNLTKEKILKLVDCADFVKLTENDKLSEGAFLLTAHFGNWEFGAIATALSINREISVLVKPQRNILVSKWLTNMRQTFGNKVIFLGTSIREIYKAISENKLVGIVGDQRGPIDAPRIKFFGKDTSMYQGTATIAIKKKKPIFVVLLRRQKDYTYKTYVEEIDHKNFIGSDEDIINQINQNYMKILEENIKACPEQWFWMHNIWKY